VPGGGCGVQGAGWRGAGCKVQGVRCRVWGARCGRLGLRPRRFGVQQEVVEEGPELLARVRAHAEVHAPPQLLRA